MATGMRASSGLVAYDDARWRDWTPVLSRIHVQGGMGCLLQNAPPGRLRDSETNVPCISGNALLFWKRGQRADAQLVGRPVRIRPRAWQFTLSPSGCDSQWTATQEATDDVFHVHLSDELIGSTAAAMGVPARLPLITLGADAVVESMARWAHDELSVAPPPALLWDSMAAALSGKLLSGHQRPGVTAPKGGLAAWQERRCTEFLRDHVAAEVSLSDLAGLVGLSTFHFARMFKQSLGVPPHRYQMLHRLERAKTLLATTDMSVLDVAVAVGYGSSQALSHAFRRDVGLTPSAYRRANRR